MKIIGLAGRAGAGKTTIGKYLEEKYGFKRLAFADQLKHMLVNAGMCTYDEVFGEKTELSRWLLQKIGTEIFRKQVDDLFWVRRMAVTVKRFHDEGKAVVIDDIRFPNEAALVRAYPQEHCLVKVVRDDDYVDATAGQDHDSEVLVDTIDCDKIFLAQSGEVDKLLWLTDVMMKNRTAKAR